MIARLAAASLAGLLTATSAQADLSYKVLSFQDLEGWEKDDHASALQVFLNTCMDMDQVDYAALCAVAESIENPRAFFELFFRPVLIEEAGKEALFTGYFEPELDGSLTPTARYQFPVYAKPREAQGQ
ncbi:MAG: MltA domain-containing protein, partial [Pseudomonadota bacterium]|nr:MltA domain-containing protein [Pseudomonadota bacterium]